MENRTGCIYAIVNKMSGKRYIGQTIRTLQSRRQSHMYSVKNKSDSLLHRAIRKYGKEAFSWEILESNVPKDKLDDLEIEYIQKFNTLHDGYNMTIGGVGFKWKYDGDNCHVCERKLANTKSVMQYSKKGVFIKEWFSSVEAGEALGMLRSTIQGVCTGKHQTAGGYMWTYKNAPCPTYNKKWHYTREVAQYNKEGTFLRTYPSLKEASESIGVAISTLSGALVGKNCTAGEFMWRYTDTSLKIPDKIAPSVATRSNRPIGIIQYTMSNEYIRDWGSLAEASRSLGIIHTGISCVCSGKRKTAGGFIWKYQ